MTNGEHLYNYRKDTEANIKSLTGSDIREGVFYFAKDTGKWFYGSPNSTKILGPIALGPSPNSDNDLDLDDGMLYISVRDSNVDDSVGLVGGGDQTLQDLLDALSTGVNQIPLAITKDKVLFGGSSDNITYENNFHWNSTSKRLGVNVASPTDTLHVGGTARIDTISTYSGATELLTHQSSVIKKKKISDIKLTEFDDTGFDIDQLNLYKNHIERIPYPGGGQKQFIGTSNYGAIGIILPITFDNNTMLSFWIDIYNYAVHESVSLYVGGYAYSATRRWHSCTAMTLGAKSNNNHTVRFGWKDGNCVIWIGELDKNWRFLQVLVRDFKSRGGSSSNGSLRDGWDIYLEDTEFTWDPTSDLQSVITISNTFPYSDWNNMINAPSIPTVNNSTITLSPGRGLKTGGAFTLNQSLNKTIVFDVDVDSLSLSDFDNDTGFITEDTYTTAAILDGTTLKFDRTDGSNQYNVNLNSLKLIDLDDTGFSSSSTWRLKVNDTPIAGIGDGDEVNFIGGDGIRVTNPSGNNVNIEFDVCKGTINDRKSYMFQTTGASSYTVPHGLGSPFVIVQMWKYDNPDYTLDRSWTVKTDGPNDVVVSTQNLIPSGTRYVVNIIKIGCLN